MAKRGPQRGARLMVAAAAAAALAEAQLSKPKALARKRVPKTEAPVRKPRAARVTQTAVAPEPVHVPAHHRENPNKLAGEALKALAHRRGLSRSSLETMDDDKIRVQLKYLAYQQYDTAGV